MPRVAYIEVEVDEDATAEEVREMVKEIVARPYLFWNHPSILSIRAVDVQTRV